MSNFIGAAAGAGGDIMQRQREADVEVASRKSIAEYTSELDRKKQEAIMALQQQYKIGDEGRAVDARRAEEAHQASPERITQLVGAERAKGEGLMANRIALAPKAGEAERAEFDAGKGVRKDKQEEALTFKLDEFSRKSTADLEADVKRMNDPKYLQGKAREAAAGRDPNSAALHRVQLQTAQLALKEKQAENKIPPGVKLMAEPIKKEMDLIAAAIAKAQAEDQFNATSDNGKALLTRHAEASRKLSDLLAPHLGPEAKKSLEVAAPAAPKNGWDPATGSVFKDGKTIGTAKSDAEARAIHAKGGAAAVKETTKPAESRPAAPEYVPPPDSPAGRRNAAMAERASQTARDREQRSSQAAAAFNAVGNDPVAASELQDSPLFSELTLAQKAKISQLVRGR